MTTTIDIKKLKHTVDTAPVDRLLGTTVPIGKLTNCPFHDDATPSFGPYILDGLPRWKCQGCGWEGDVIDFLVKKLGITTGEAIRQLSNKPPSPLLAAKKGQPGWETAPWEQWQDLTEQVYEQICAMRAGRGYMPLFETLLCFGFRQWKDRYGKILVGYPVAGWDMEHADCIKYFRPTAKTKPDYCFDGPYRKQNRLFGLGVMPPSGRSNVSASDETTRRAMQDFLRHPENFDYTPPVSFCRTQQTHDPTQWLNECIFLVEGQWDCMALWELGYRAYGLLSSGQTDIVPGILQGLNTAECVFLMADNDDAGKKCNQRLLPLLDKGCPYPHTIIVNYPEHIHDLCDMVEECALDGLDEALQQVIETAVRQRMAIPPSTEKPYIPGIDIRCVDDAEIKDTDWLWPYRIVANGLNVWNGPADVGKTTGLMDLVARATTGADWPDAKNENSACSVLLVADEDSIEEDLKPALLAAGADTKRVHYVAGFNNPDQDHTTRMLALDEDCEKLKEALRQYPDIKLVIFDPLTNYLGKLKKNSDQEIRSVLMKLRRLARETEIAVISVDHFNKDTKQTVAAYRQSGTQAFTAVPRLVWSFLPVEDEEDVGEPHDKEATYGKMLSAKGNKLPPDKRKGLLYKIVGQLVPGLGKPVGRFVWLGIANQSANQALAGRPPLKRKAAVNWIREYLADGPRSSDDFYQDARDAGFNTRAERGESDSTLQRACAEVCVESWQTPKGWMKGLRGSKQAWREEQAEAQKEQPSLVADF